MDAVNIPKLHVLLLPPWSCWLCGTEKSFVSFHGLDNRIFIQIGRTTAFRILVQLWLPCCKGQPRSSDTLYRAIGYM